MVLIPDIVAVVNVASNLNIYQTWFFLNVRNSSAGRLPNKRRIQTRYKLPLLNWATIPATQVAGTVFNQLDDERILQVLNFDEFEERFKRNDAHLAAEATDSITKSVKSEPLKRKKESVLAPNRSQNVAIARKKVTASVDALKQSIAL